MLLVYGTSTAVAQEDTTAAAPDWSVHGVIGMQALGVSPVPANLNGALGAEWAGRRGPVYRFRLGAELGFHVQTQLTAAVSLDVPLINRFMTPWGLYGDLEFVFGGELSWITLPTWRAGDDGVIEETRSPIDPNLRVALGAAVGVDLREYGALPLRIFLRYRQYVLWPYMDRNDVPVMGLGALSLGVAWEFGS